MLVMSSGTLSQVLRQLCRLVGAKSVEELSDRQLLEAFAQHHDADAFAVLVQRHGPMVLGICRRVLQDAHDAEDAFQATFLVLARKSGAIRRQEAVGHWLCGTAYRVALKARAAAGRRREQERQAGTMPKSNTDVDPQWREVRPVLDEELNRLPPKYRAPLVLCYLQGKTNEVAARELGWAPGSMSYRLSQAREKLRSRLVQRGVALSAGGLGTLLAERASAAVQAPLLDATVRASVAFATGGAVAAGVSTKVVVLADAGLKAIWLSQAKIIAATVAAGLVLVVGLGVAVYRAGGANGSSRPTAPDTAAPRPTDYNDPRIVVQFSESQRFGLVCPRLNKPLTRQANGTTNNTCFKIDGREYIFGIDVPGVRWARDKHNKMIKGAKVGEWGWESAIEITDGDKAQVRITQTVKVVRGEQTDLLDTLLVVYRVQNLDSAPHTVGLRFLLDTLIGKNDGVPFLIPPTDKAPAHMVDTMEIFTRTSIPDFIRALETENLDDKKATNAELNLKLAGYEPLERLVICRWPDNSEIRWDWVFQPMNEPAGREKDSCTVLYWADRAMKPNEERLMGFTYGLGQIYGEGSGGSADGGGGGSAGKMRLLTAGSYKIGKAFTATLYVKGEPLVGQKIALQLPAGLVLAEGQPVEQTVPRMGPQGYSQVSWRVCSTQTGKFTLKAGLGKIETKQDVIVTEQSLFD
jgi:RNA polymerase sigma factor (sigma-70 family)